MFTSDDFLDEEIFEEEVLHAIKILKWNKAPGLDGLVPELFNNELITFLTRIFKTAFCSGIFPRSWSIGSIIPIHKKGDEKLPSDYRGLPIMGKLLSSILNDRLL